MIASPLRQQLFRRKPVSAMVAETGGDDGGGGLARRIGPLQLVVYVTYSRKHSRLRTPSR